MTEPDETPDVVAEAAPVVVEALRHVVAGELEAAGQIVADGLPGLPHAQAGLGWLLQTTARLVIDVCDHRGETPEAMLRLMAEALAEQQPRTWPFGTVVAPDFATVKMGPGDMLLHTMRTNPGVLMDPKDGPTGMMRVEAIGRGTDSEDPQTVVWWTTAHGAMQVAGILADAAQRAQAAAQAARRSAN